MWLIGPERTANLKAVIRVVQFLMIDLSVPKHNKQTTEATNDAPVSQAKHNGSSRRVPECEGELSRSYCQERKREERDHEANCGAQ